MYTSIDVYDAIDATKYIINTIINSAFENLNIDKQRHR